MSGLTCSMWSLCRVTLRKSFEEVTLRRKHLADHRLPGHLSPRDGGGYPKKRPCLS